MNPLHLDYFPIVVAAVLNMVVGYLWYSKWLFGPHWMKLARMTEGETKNKKSAPLFGLLNSLVIAYFISFFEHIAHIANVSDGMFFSFFLWLGFSATTQMSAVIWTKKSFPLFLLEAGGSLLGFLVMGGFIAS